MTEIVQTTKEKIFFAAIELFAEKGYADTSVRDIAAKVGIKPSSLYNHFESKEELFSDVFDTYLVRMDSFYETLRNVELTPEEKTDLSVALRRLIFVYEPEETQMMYWLTRIVHYEQFRFKTAADAVIGSGYKEYLDAHVRYLDYLSDLGLIHGKERNQMYGEMFARISITFAMQFLHPEVEHTLPDQELLYDEIIPLVVNSEKMVAAQL